jgi:hypothetical protein
MAVRRWVKICVKLCQLQLQLLRSVNKDKSCHFGQKCSLQLCRIAQTRIHGACYRIIEAPFSYLFLFTIDLIDV